MKKNLNKIALTAVLAMSFVSAGASAGWSSISSYPSAKSPVYHSITTKDKTNKVELTFACSSDFKGSVLMSVNKLELKDKEGDFFFSQSLKDKHITNIKGTYNTSNDGYINLNNGFTKTVILDDMKKMYGTTLSFAKEGKTFKNIEFDLKGSGTNLNLFNAKCAKL